MIILLIILFCWLVGRMSECWSFLLPPHPQQTLNFAHIFKAPPDNDRTANLGLGGQHSCKQLLALPLLPDLLAIITIIVMMLVMMMIWLGEGDKPRQHWRWDQEPPVQPGRAVPSPEQHCHHHRYHREYYYDDYYDDDTDDDDGEDVAIRHTWYDCEEYDDSTTWLSWWFWWWWLLSDAGDW